MTNNVVKCLELPKTISKETKITNPCILLIFPWLYSETLKSVSFQLLLFVGHLPW